MLFYFKKELVVFHDKFDLANFVERQRDFSSQAFGPGSRRIGVANHILQECDEVEAKPDDLSEWVDVMLLSLDAAWRSGLPSERLVQMIESECDSTHDGGGLKALHDDPCLSPKSEKGGKPSALSLVARALQVIRAGANQLKATTADIPTVYARLFVAACQGAVANGYDLEMISSGLEAKLERNRNRTWPDWRTMSEDDAINHNPS